jgi:hypothetical protein
MFRAGENYLWSIQPSIRHSWVITQLNTSVSGSHSEKDPFVWMCIRYSYEGTGKQKPRKVVRSKTNILRDWYTGIYTEIARNKVGDMGKNRFENIIVEFAPNFENLKPLACELRFTLFPIRNGDIFTGTFQDYNIMYNKMIIAFNTAVGRLRKKEQSIA